MTAQRRTGSALVKLSTETHKRLQRLSLEEHRPMGEIVTDLLDRYERDRFWKDVTESVDRLRRDPEAWKDYQDEIAVLEGASLDGLGDDAYFTPEEEEAIRASAARSEGR